MTQLLIQKTQSLYSAFGEGRIKDLLALLADNVDWDHDTVNHGIPWLKNRQGIGGAQDFFEILPGELEITKFNPISFLSNENQVCGVVELEATVRRTGKKFKDLEIHLFTFDSSGKVSRFRHFVDTKLHHNAIS